MMISSINNWVLNLIFVRINKPFNINTLFKQKLLNLMLSLTISRKIRQTKLIFSGPTYILFHKSLLVVL
uniref:Putative ovule protein n=1 Tax=Solanum chacoense TaxID=4108 RepID=A0A0V0GGE5_SOLCH